MLYFLLIISCLFSEPYDGLTLVSIDQATLLINNDNDTLNIWNHDQYPSSICYMQKDSTLICPLSDHQSGAVNSAGGKFIKYDWNSNILWEYDLPDSICLPHHDISLLPNGNILSICTEHKSQDEVINMGFIGEIDSVFGFDTIIELQPIGTNGAQIVWNWKSFDHLIQDVNPHFENYGIVSDHPELLNINMETDGNTTFDWLHLNAVSYNESLNQIVVSSRFTNEFYVIDHSTTTTESASHQGGIYNKGGDILYRWGNPQNYNRGTNADKILGAQHGVDWIPSGYPGEGNLLLFNNQHLYYGGPANPNNKSAILEIEPPIDENGFYTIDDLQPFNPESPIIVYQNDFFSNFQSGAFRLPNGNSIITSTGESQILEINQYEEIELSYNNYTTARAIKYQNDYLTPNQMLGDINNDQIVNILDVIVLVNIVLGNSAIVSSSDLNIDGVVNVLDVVFLVNLIL